MEQVPLLTDEDQLFEAFKMGRKYFPKIPAEELLETLDLCLQNSGLHVIPESELLFAFFRYDPREFVEDPKRNPKARDMHDVVTEYDIKTLKTRDLTSGPVVHVVGFSAPKCDGYKLFRELIAALNPFGISFHRLRKNGLYAFAYRKHVRWKKHEV